jgi:hypothetical protein
MPDIERARAEISQAEMHTSRVDDYEAQVALIRLTRAMKFLLGDSAEGVGPPPSSDLDQSARRGGVGEEAQRGPR